jgi:hypothetical protein
MSATVVSVTEQAGQGGDVSGTASEFVRRFIVIISEPSTIGADLAANASGIPAIGAAWPNNISGRATPTVRTKSVGLLAEGQSRLHWRVTVNYSNERSGSTANTPDPNVAPWTLAPVYSSDSIVVQKALDRDFSGTPKTVENSVGDAFDPVPVRDQHNTRIVIARNTTTWNENTAAQLRGTLNSGAVTIAGVSYPARRCRLIRWSAQQATWTNDSGSAQTYYEQSLEIEATPDGLTHDIEILNRGYRARPEGGAEPVRVTDADGNPVPEPVLLDANGLVTGTPVYLTFVPAPTASWSALGSL